MERTMEHAALGEHSVLGLAPDVAEGMSLLLFVLAALMLLLVTFAAMKRRRNGQKSLPGAGIVLLLIGVMSFVGALVLKLS